MDTHPEVCACRLCLLRKADTLLRSKGADSLCITHTLRPKSKERKPKVWTRNPGFGKPLTNQQSGLRVALWGLDTGHAHKPKVRTVKATIGVVPSIDHDLNARIAAYQERRDLINRAYPALAYKPGFGG